MFFWWTVCIFLIFFCFESLIYRENLNWHDFVDRKCGEILTVHDKNFREWISKMVFKSWKNKRFFWFFSHFFHFLFIFEGPWNKKYGDHSFWSKSKKFLDREYFWRNWEESFLIIFSRNFFTLKLELNNDGFVEEPERNVLVINWLNLL